jgi:ADP-glucose pyrophosphorylase
MSFAFRTLFDDSQDCKFRKSLDAHFPFTWLSLLLQAYLFKDYWEDIGTIKSFFDANLALTDSVSAPCRPSAPLHSHF